MKLLITDSTGARHSVESGLIQPDDARNQVLIAGATRVDGVWVNPAHIVTIAIVPEPQPEETHDEPETERPKRRLFGR